MSDSVGTECPPLYESHIRQRFGTDFIPALQAMIPPATLDLRVNLCHATRDQAQSLLMANNVHTHPTPYAEAGLRCAGKVFLSHTRAFAKGWIEIQDEGSQLIAQMCAVKPSDHVLDFCAGAGGKTLALANAMLEDKRPKGRIVAMDIDLRRLEKGRERFRRAGVSDIIEMRHLECPKKKKWLRRQKQTFDVVLCDVPCTGTGTWRRNPDMRWYHYGPPLSDILTIQSQILERVAPAVKEGGYLVYATCSLLPEENEEQIKTFLSLHPEFVLEPPPFACPQPFPPFLHLAPHTHGTDGFFAARLKRIAPIPS